MFISVTHFLTANFLFFLLDNQVNHYKDHEHHQIFICKGEALFLFLKWLFDITGAYSIKFLALITKKHYQLSIFEVLEK